MVNRVVVLKMMLLRNMLLLLVRCMLMMAMTAATMVVVNLVTHTPHATVTHNGPHATLPRQLGRRTNNTHDMQPGPLRPPPHLNASSAAFCDLKYSTSASPYAKLP